MAATFSEKHKSFAAHDSRADRDALRRLIERKKTLLQTLDPAAQEGLFSLRPAHWLRHPLLAGRYGALVAKENAILGTRQAVPMAQAYWRAVHILLAYVFVAGILIHVGTVTFFAGYVADYGPIGWWHLSAW